MPQVVARDVESFVITKRSRTKICGFKALHVIKWAVALLLLLSGVVFACTFDVKTLLTGAAKWTEDHKAAGLFVFAGIYILGTCIFLPGSLLALGAGAMFGIRIGFPLIWTSGIVADSIAFFISRFLFRSFWMDKLKSLGQEMAAIDQVTSEQGWKVVFLLRLAPFFPYSILNYTMGVTAISFKDYFIASAFGIIPGTFVYVLIGHKARSLEEALSSHKELNTFTLVLLFILTCSLLIIALLWVGNYAKKLVRSQLQEKR